MGTAIVETPSGEEITVTYEGQKTEEEILQLANEQLRLRALETLLGRDDEVAEDKVPAVITPERKPATVRDEVAGAMARPFIGALGLGQDIVNLSYQNMGLLGDALGIEDDDKLVSDELVNKLKRKVADGVASVASADTRFTGLGFQDQITAIKNNEEFLYIPSKYAHGYLTLTSNTIVTYLVKGEYNPESEHSIVWDTIPSIKKIVDSHLQGCTIWLSDKDRLGK